MGYRRLLTILSIVGSIASIIALIIVFLPKHSIATLDVKSSSVENLTDIEKNTEPEFTTKFEYKSLPIIRLWKVNIQMINSSDKTFVGKGKIQNTLVDTIEIFLKPGFQVIDKKNIRSDFEHWLGIKSNNTIQLTFAQWRKLESLEYAFYIKSDSVKQLPDELFLQPKERQLLDGEIRFVKSDNHSDRELITDFIPKQIKKSVYIIILIFLGLLIFVFLGILIVNPIGYNRRFVWRKKYFELYKKYIDERYSTNKKIKERLKYNPEINREWNGFPYPRYPEDLILDFENKDFWSFLLAMIFSLLFLLSMIIIFIDLIQLIP